MRILYQITAVAAIVMFILGVKAVIPTPTAIAAVETKIDIMQMQVAEPNLPTQFVRDMTFALDE